MLSVHGTVEVPHLVIDRPVRANALTAELLERLADTVGERLADGARALVVTGAGGRFSSGADLERLADAAAIQAVERALEQATQSLATAPVPTVAAVERYAFGAGVDLAWTCDVVVAAQDSVVAIPATRIGILYNPSSLRRLHARLGSSVLRQLLVAGRELAGAEMADVVVGAGQTITVATELAEAASALDQRSVAATKQVLDDLDHGRSAPDEWDELVAELLASTRWIERAGRLGK